LGGGTAPEYVGVALSEVTEPARTWAIADTAYNSTAAGYVVQGYLTTAYQVNSATYAPWALRHSLGDNFSFVDGHVKWLKYSQYHTINHRYDGQTYW